MKQQGPARCICSALHRSSYPDACCATLCCAVSCLQHLELEEVVSLAKEVGGPQHGFMAIQAPINLKMNEAYTQKWQRVVNKTATDAAAKAAQTAAEAAAKATAAAAAAAKAAAEAEAEEAAAAGTPLPQARSPPPPAPPPPPPLAPIVVHNKVSLADAAVDLGVQLFASAPLMEVRLLGCTTGRREGAAGFRLCL